MNLQQQIRDYVGNELLMQPDIEIDYAENLLISGLLDSLALMRLVMHLEDSHDIEISPRDITLENFASLDTMSDYLSSRLSAQTAA